MVQQIAIHVASSVFLLLLVCNAHAADPVSNELRLNKQNYAAWRDRILPGEKDLGWQKIPWLTTFQDGILDANQRNRPLLLWTMNGHPLGCT